jgi:hypothetical protein
MRVGPIDRSRLPYRDDPVLARLTDDEVWALARLLARLARATARRLEAEAERPELEVRENAARLPVTSGADGSPST